MSAIQQQHTILLLQHNKTSATTSEEQCRLWSEYSSISLASESLISMYEKRLKELNPGVRSIQYNVKDFNNYLDNMADACALVFDPKSLTYSPKDKEWLKQKVLQSFQKMAVK